MSGQAANTHANLQEGAARHSLTLQHRFQHRFNKLGPNKFRSVKGTSAAMASTGGEGSALFRRRRHPADVAETAKLTSEAVPFKAWKTGFDPIRGIDA